MKKRKFLTTDHFFISQSLFNEESKKRVIIFETEIYLMDIYCSLFRRENFLPFACRDLGQLEEQIISVNPHVVVISVNQDLNFLKLLLGLDSIKQKFNQLPFISYGYTLELEKIRQLMDRGVFSYLDRKFSRPSDLLKILQSLFVK